MSRLRRASRALLLLSTLAVVTGCASGRAQPVSLFGGDYASWDHFRFSARMAWRKFTGWPLAATPEDAALARQQGGWWGDEVPVVEPLPGPRR